MTYTLREVIDQINRKLDVLPGLVNRQTALETEQAKISARLGSAEADIDELKRHDDQAAAVALFREKGFTKMVGLATVMGVVAGGTVGLIQVLA